MILQNTENIDHYNKSGIWQSTRGFLGQYISFGEDITISIFDVLIVITAIFITTVVLRTLLRIITRNLPLEDRGKFNALYSYFRWLIYIIIFLVTLHSIGINVTAIFAASAALLIGVGLALQTLFQDVISGVSILIDQTVHVGDVIELEGKVCRVEEIKLRTTRAVTIDNKILIIPNHFYLKNSLFNWTQNGVITRENVETRVAFGTDVQLVKKLLLEAARTHNQVVSKPGPIVLFTDFGESALNFRLIFTLQDSFKSQFAKSDIRFEIDRLFRENNIIIPVPQRGVHVLDHKTPSK